MTLMMLAGPPTATPDAASALIEWCYYAALALAVGIGLTVGVLAPGGVLARRARVLALPVAGFVAVSGVARLAELSSNPLGPGKTTMLLVVQAVAYLLLIAALVVWWLSSARRAAGAVLVLGVLTVVIPQLPIGPLVAQRVATGVGTGLHFAAVVLWIGGLLVLAVLGAFGWRTDADRPDVGEEWARVWARFSVVALWSVGVLVVTGSWMAWMHLGSPMQLVTTSYGRLLTLKLLIVVALMSAGAYNARVALPRLDAARSAGDDRAVWRIAVERFPKIVAVEAVLGLVVIAIVPFFTGSPRLAAGFGPPRSFDLTVFGTGLVLTALVALTMVVGTRGRDRPQSGPVSPVAEQIPRSPSD